MSNRWKTTLQVCSVLLVILGLPVIFHGLLKLESDTTDMRQWLPEGRQERRRYERFVAQFGPDDFVLVSWPGCTLDDERIPQFATAAIELAGGEGRRHLIRRIVTGPALLDRLTSKPFGLSRRTAVNRLQNTFIGRDGNATCLLVEVTDAGNSDPHAVIDVLTSVGQERCGLTRDQLRLGGGIYEAVLIDEESQRSFRDFVGLSGFVVLAVAFFSLRSIRLTALVVASGVYCGMLSMAVVFYAGASMNPVMIVLPTLIFVLVISGAVHLVNYYRDAIREGGLAGASGRALAMGWFPCSLAVATTAIGMLSLATSQIGAVRSFGVNAAAGLIVSLFVLLVFLPAAFDLWPARGPGRGWSRQAATPHHALSDRMAQFVIRHHVVLSVVSAILLLGLGVGMARTRSSVELEDMFRADHELTRNYRWLEEHIGPLASLEVLVQFGEGNVLTMFDRFSLVQQMERRIGALDEVGATLSATTLAPPAPTSAGLRATVQRALFKRKLEAARPHFVEDRVLARTNSTETWRITARVPALREVDYGSVIESVDRELGSILAEVPHSSATIKVRYTGTILAMHYARRQLLDDLVRSFLLAFLLICPVMMVILRSFSAGLVAMGPNIVPAVTVFGGLGWLNIPIDIGTVLTASVALGIAVDDTLHLLTWYRRGLRRGLSPSDAVRSAYRRCSLAMIQTTMICGLGLLVFAGSSFVPAIRFSVLMFVLLVAALLGDLVLFPALLAGPIGRLFGPVHRLTPSPSALERSGRIDPRARP